MSEKLLSKEALEAVEKLADIVNNKELEEVTIANGDNIITVKGRRCPPPPMPMGMPPFQHDMMPVTMNAAAAGAAPTVEAQNAVCGNVVKAPIVGTFYSAPDPSKPPFAEVGKHVKKGDVLMIIESMKLMNEITSEYDGVVKQILVKNGEAVDYDQPVMIIE